ncbi:hypothetical protein C0Z18_30900 [Trinickia dabaoshanensis]|uniref:Type II/III secretion system secretin-like domain-containing protein n=1 Tax=Trinickia dabaoshanensis TaxID=564714 RepID=A0A2N7VBW2_9BURK|nr:hypothetical protein [Trinickia dabaoshanensis]PMS14658.1 hypothetical protein C0Z18_30900 [Trinickia dabaoshanensis]
MTSNVKRSVVLVMMTLLTGCGTVMERNEIRGAVNQGSQAVSDRMARLRQEDQQKAAVVREIDGVWLGGKTVKVSRDAELPAVFSQPIRFAFPDQPTLTIIADRISKIVGMPVRVSADALIPIEIFSAQRMGMMMGGMGGSSMMQSGVGGLAAANGVRLPSGVAMPPQSGPIGQYAPSMTTMGGYQPIAQARSFIIDQTSPFGGTLTELLDQVSGKFGVGWDYKDGTISISRLVTRTYQIASITDTNDVTATIAKTASTGETTGGGSGGGTGTTMSQAGSASSSSDVSSKLSASVDVVKGLKTAIEAALTPNGIGKYSISSSGVVTVTDTREVQEQIRDLIEAENESVGRQVRMRMQIVDVSATTNNDMGVDWSWVINQAAAKWNVNFFSPTGLSSTSTGFGQLGVIRNGGNGYSTTQTFLQALATVGKVNIRKDETYTMLNNRPLSIANTENFIYPARSSPAASVTNGATAVPGIEPGQLTTGTFLNMRASIQPNGSVVVQFSMDASTRGNTVTLDSNGVKLQYPQSTANQYQIYASIVNGETAVLAGLDDTQQQATDKSFDGTLTPLLGGGISTATTRHAVLVLLTPQIVEGVN